MDDYTSRKDLEKDLFEKFGKYKSFIKNSNENNLNVRANFNSYMHQFKTEQPEEFQILLNHVGFGPINSNSDKKLDLSNIFFPEKNSLQGEDNKNNNNYCNNLNLNSNSNKTNKEFFTENDNENYNSNYIGNYYDDDCDYFYRNSSEVKKSSQLKRSNNNKKKIIFTTSKNDRSKYQKDEVDTLGKKKSNIKKEKEIEIRPFVAENSLENSNIYKSIEKKKNFNEAKSKSKSKSKKTEEENLYKSPMNKNIQQKSYSLRKSNNKIKENSNFNEVNYVREFSAEKNQSQIQNQEKSNISLNSIGPNNKNLESVNKKRSAFTKNVSNFSNPLSASIFYQKFCQNQIELADLNFSLKSIDVFKLSSSCKLSNKEDIKEEMNKSKMSSNKKSNNGNSNINCEKFAEKNVTNFQNSQNSQNLQNSNFENMQKISVPNFNKYKFSIVPVNGFQENNNNSTEIKSKFVLTKQNRSNFFTQNGLEKNNLKTRVRYRMISAEEKKFCIQLLDYFDFNSVSKMCNVPLKSLKRWSIVGHERRKGGGRKTKDPIMEKRVVDWIKKQQNKGKFVNTKMIKKIALKLSQDKSFLASKGWLEKLKKKYNLKISKISKCNKSELLSSNDEDGDIKNMEIDGNDYGLENRDSSLD